MGSVGRISSLTLRNGENATIIKSDNVTTGLIQHPFTEGGSHITTTKKLDDFSGPEYLNHGPDSGLYITPKKDMDSLLRNSTSRTDIEQQLGLNKGALQGGDLIRLDIPNPLDRNLRLPDPNSGNVHHIPGSGRTPGGQMESVINPPTKVDPIIIVQPIKLKPKPPKSTGGD